MSKKVHSPVPVSAPVKKHQVNVPRLTAIARELLLAIGEDPDRPGLRDTPKRVAESWREFIEFDPGNYDRTFEAVTTNQLVIVRGLRVWSLCEHHLLPFWSDIAIGYMTGKEVLGLSKFARISHLCAHRLQVQERLVHEIADAVQEVTGSPHVAVLAEGVHLCMVMRGVRTPGTMVSSVVRGEFHDSPSTRAEFLSLARGSSPSF